MTQEKKRHLGPYRLGSILGRGGSSTVYEAVDERDDRQVALKVVAAPSDPREEEALARRMERSSRAMTALDHPNIARVYETGEAQFSDALPDALPARYIALERVEGTTLRERLKREDGPLSLSQAADILQQVAQGLDAVHAAGVMHRDIKPSNILLTTDGIVKLTDFGIARRVEDTMVTLDGVMIGSPHYISPEQTANQPATTSSDLWSLGVVLYEMVIGKVPFAGESIPVTLYQVAHGDFPALPLYLPPSVRAVISRALMRDPAKRFPSAVSLAESFRSAVEQVSLAPAESVRYRYSTPKRTSVAPVALTLAVVGGIALVAGGFLAAPRLAKTIGGGTSVVSDMERRPVTTPTGTAAPRKDGLPSPKNVKRPSLLGALHAEKPVKAINSPEAGASPPASTAPLTVTVSPSPSALTVREKAPVVAPPGPVSRHQRDKMPTTAVPSPPPLEVSRESPSPELQPLPKTVIRPTPAPATPTPPVDTPAPTPTPTPTLAPTPTPVPQTSTAEGGNEEGIEAVDPNTRLTGTWQGTHTGHTAHLVLRALNRDTGEFRGALTVEMPSGPVRIAITGQVFDDGGITIRENKVLQASEDRVWDLGVNTGIFDPEALTLSGQGRDKKGRTYLWSFRR